MVPQELPHIYHRVHKSSQGTWIAKCSHQHLATPLRHGLRNFFHHLCCLLSQRHLSGGQKWIKEAVAIDFFSLFHFGYLGSLSHLGRGFENNLPILSSSFPPCSRFVSRMPTWGGSTIHVLYSTLWLHGLLATWLLWAAHLEHWTCVCLLNLGFFGNSLLLRPRWSLLHKTKHTCVVDIIYILYVLHVCMYVLFSTYAAYIIHM